MILKAVNELRESGIWHEDCSPKETKQEKANRLQVDLEKLK